MRRTPILLALLATSCSSHPGPPIAPPVPPVVPTPEVVATTPDAAPDAAPADLRCHAAVRMGIYEGETPDATAARIATYEPSLVLGGDDDAFDLDYRLKGVPHRGVCEVRERHKLGAKIAAAAAPASLAATPAWDKRRPLEYDGLVRSALALTPDEMTRLARDGMVVPARLEYQNFGQAYYDIHRGQLPVFVSIDSILNAVYLSHAKLVASVERTQLMKRLDRMLGAMHCGLAGVAGDYPAEVATDIDAYLTIARSLLAYQRIRTQLGPAADATVDHILRLVAPPNMRTVDGAWPEGDAANAPHVPALSVVELFGRKRNLDATQFTPRGHYDSDEELQRYFRAAMWLSRVELNLVSRDSRSSQPGMSGDPSETPREAVVALALADLADRTGALADLTAIERAWTSFAGVREDVSFADLTALRKSAGIGALTAADTAARLRTAIGERYVRTVNVHPMPNVRRLPVIATMIGPRITPEAAAIGDVLAGRGARVEASELAFVLGSDRALAHVRPDPKLERRLRDARGKLSAAARGDDLYSSWLAAIGKLADMPAGALPSFTSTSAYRDLRLNSTIAAYGQLRHSHVLLQAQNYEQGGCEIPDGYVEPAVATYEALIAYAARGAKLFAELDPDRRSGGARYFTRLEGILKTLLAIARTQLANAPLSQEQRRFLAMIAEMRPEDDLDYSGPFPTPLYNGWYFDLFTHDKLAFDSPAFVVDYATFDDDGATGIHYLGAKRPRLGVFVVDVGGVPRMMVGPVARAFEHTGPLAKRLTDRDADTVTGRAPWEASYTVAGVAEPKLAVSFHRPIDPKYDHGLRRGGSPAKDDNIVKLTADRDLGTVQVDLLDHHFVAMGTVSARVTGTGTVGVATPRTPRPIEGLRVRVGGFSGRVDLDLMGRGRRDFGH